MILRLLDSFTDPDVELYNELLGRLKNGCIFKIEDKFEYDYILSLKNNSNNEIEESFGSHYRHKLRKEYIEKHFLPEFIPPLLRAGDIVFLKKISGDRVYLKLVHPSESRPQDNGQTMKTDYLTYQSSFVETLQQYIDHHNHTDLSRMSPYIYSLYKHWGLFKEGDLQSFSENFSSTSLLNAHDREIIQQGFKNLQSEIHTKGFPTRNIKVIQYLYNEEFSFSIDQLERYIHDLYQKQFERFSLEEIPLR